MFDLLYQFAISETRSLKWGNEIWPTRRSSVFYGPLDPEGPVCAFEPHDTKRDRCFHIDGTEPIRHQTRNGPMLISRWI